MNDFNYSIRELTNQKQSIILLRYFELIVTPFIIFVFQLLFVIHYQFFAISMKYLSSVILPFRLLRYRISSVHSPSLYLFTFYITITLYYMRSLVRVDLRACIELVTIIRHTTATTTVL